MTNLRKLGLNPLTTREEFFTPMSSLFDQMFERTFPELKGEFGIDFGKSAYPKCNVIDHDTYIEIVSEIPGLTKEDVSIDINDRVLTISGKKSKVAEDMENVKFIHRELKHSSFKRSFTLGELLDLEAINAKFENGILSIVIDKVEIEEKPKTRSIDIK